jgi:hypothetical protein
LGYGTQFAPELNEEHRIVDSAVQRAYADAAGDTDLQSATEMSLAQRIAQVKRRAQRLGVASTAEEWQKLLAECGKEQIENVADLVVINGRLTQAEREATGQPVSKA